MSNKLCFKIYDKYNPSKIWHIAYDIKSRKYFYNQEVKGNFTYKCLQKVTLKCLCQYLSLSVEEFKDIMMQRKESKPIKVNNKYSEALKNVLNHYPKQGKKYSAKSRLRDKLERYNNMSQGVFNKK